MSDDLRRSSVHQYLSIVKDIGPINNVQRFPYVMIGDQDPDSAILKMCYQFPNVIDGDRIDPRERLVQYL